jgi:hypothetical protein
VDPCIIVSILLSYSIFIILYLSYIAYDRPGLTPEHFLVFYLCSRIGLLPYNPACRPAFIETQQLLGSLPSFWFSRVAATTSLHLLLSHTPMSFSYHRLETPGVGGVRCLIHVVFLWDLPGEAERSHRVGFLAVRPFDSSAEGGRDFLSLTLTRSVYCACLRPPTGRANRALVLGVLSGAAHLIS